ncbi:MAG: hypothetical protein LC791_08940 [Acidobacteria bacterium]|nr:hypothetical protein [Acidobacteriota bacterium]
MTRADLAVMLIVVAVIASPLTAQSKRSPPRKATPARQAPAPPTRVQAELQCPAELGLGVRTKRRFCDVLSGRDAKDGIFVTIPPHRGPVTLSFELHNRHTYSEDLVKTKQAFRQYTGTIGVLTMDNTLVDRAIVQSEFRTEQDLFDRISGGAGPGGIKAVAPLGGELIVMELPEDAVDQVSILGEKLTVVRPDGTDNFSAPGRPIATISNVMLEYRPAPPRKP